MCGIIAYLSKETIHNRDVHHMLHNMLWIDSIRGDHSTGLLDAYQTAAVFLDGKLGIFDLAFSALAAELHDQFPDLADTGGANGMPFGFKPAGYIEGNFAPQFGGAAFSEPAAFSNGAEPKHFRLNDLSK